MLKLPKGLKKKKKGHKSKKDKELFTEEELNQYRREHQHDQEQSSAAATSAVTSADEDTNPNKGAVDEEWSKFAALTTGVDSILKKTQGDLDRIKKESFFQRVPPPSEKAAAAQAKDAASTSDAPPAEERDIVQELISAVVQISESEGESDVEEDIFDTNYTDAIASGELALAYVPESPEEEALDGPDPFDTSYADKVIKGPEVSKKGKKIVHIGSAVEVLTGRIESVSQASTTSKRPRRGPKNLLLQSFDADNADEIESTEASAVKTVPEPVVKSLLDDNDDLDVEDTEIDLSVSLHLTLQKAAAAESSERQAVDEIQDNSNRETDFTSVLPVKSELEQTWSEFEGAAVKHSDNSPTVNLDEDDDDFVVGPDPFDTAFVDRVLPADYDDDFDPRAEDDFDPRADEEEVKPAARVQVQQPEPAQPERDILSSPDEHLNTLSLVKSDLLSSSNCDLSEIVQTPLAPSNNPEISFDDPFDTSAVSSIVAPGKTELKFLEEELLLKKQGLADDHDFDPRAEEKIDRQIESEFESLAQRKSSLNLKIDNSLKLVTFIVPPIDKGESNGKIQKPLTPYYNKNTNLEETLDDSQPAELKTSLSDPDFDPRGKSLAPTSGAYKPVPDLLSCIDDHSIKALTPAIDTDIEEQFSYADPFDTSIAQNIVPGKAELKVIEKEFLPSPINPPSDGKNIDFLAENQDSEIYVKVLTPQLSQTTNSIDDFEIDPFDTSFANNIQPGKAEINQLEKELIN